jgi:hypothetical protein
MVDLEKVVRRDTETFDQRALDCLRYFAETNFIILTFQHVYLCERHVGLLLKCRGEDKSRLVSLSAPSLHAW